MAFHHTSLFPRHHRNLLNDIKFLWAEKNCEAYHQTVNYCQNRNLSFAKKNFSKYSITICVVLINTPLSPPIPEFPLTLLHQWNYAVINIVTL